MNTHYGLKDGQTSIALCNNSPASKNCSVTKNRSAVTCKHCLKILESLWMLDEMVNKLRSNDLLETVDCLSLVNQNVPGENKVKSNNPLTNFVYAMDRTDYLNLFYITVISTIVMIGIYSILFLDGLLSGFWIDVVSVFYGVITFIYLVLLHWGTWR